MHRYSVSRTQLKCAYKHVAARQK